MYLINLHSRRPKHARLPSVIFGFRSMHYVLRGSEWVIDHCWWQNPRFVILYPLSTYIMLTLLWTRKCVQCICLRLINKLYVISKGCIKMWGVKVKKRGLVLLVRTNANFLLSHNPLRILLYIYVYCILIARCVNELEWCLVFTLFYEIYGNHIYSDDIYSNGLFHYYFNFLTFFTSLHIVNGNIRSMGHKFQVDTENSTVF